MDKRDRMAAVIRILLSKTTSSGCTEGEATSAAEKARILMDKYHIDQGALGMEAEGTTQGYGAAQKVRNVVFSDYVALAVAGFCDCKTWKKTWAAEAQRHVFFGLDSDTEFASWLLDSLCTFIKGNLPPVSDATPRERWAYQRSFVRGAAVRINKRLNDLTNERQAVQHRADGRNALVVLKGAIVEREFQALRLNLKTSTKRTKGSTNASGYAAGEALGDRASFGRPVSTTLRIA